MANANARRQSRRDLARAARHDPVRRQPTVGPEPPAALVASYFRAAPLPEPAELAAYEQLVPGAAGMIINGWRDETLHRREREVTGDNRKFWLSIGGQAGAFLLGAGALALIAYAIHERRATLDGPLMWAVAALVAAMAGRAIWPYLKPGGDKGK